jgi:DNA-binding PadR family transcriptional regulator
VAASTLTLLEYALLGLLHQTPQSGYALRKLFATTPLAHFSDSPGSIYPALRRLQARKLIAGTVEREHVLRPRQTFRLTDAGRTALKAWAGAPVTEDDVIYGSDSLMLRFSFVDQVLGAEAARAFLVSLEAAVAAHLPSLQKFYDGAKESMPLSGRLALKHGIDSHRAWRRWAQDGIAAYDRAARKEDV